MNRTDVEPSIWLKDVFAGYLKGEEVLRNVNGVISGSGVCLLSGPNGAGKSTLFEVISGFLQPFSGVIEVCGERRQAGLAKLVALVRSEPALTGFLTLRDNLALFRGRFGADREYVDYLVDGLNLGEHLDKLPSELSTGTLRKAWIICGLVSGAPVVCLDEPLNGLDVDAVRFVTEQILHAGEERLVLLISHTLPPTLKTELGGEMSGNYLVSDSGLKLSPLLAA